MATLDDIAKAELHAMADRLRDLAGSSASCDLTIGDESFAIDVTPARTNAAPIHVAYYFAEGLIEARFGRHVKAQEWIESREELVSAITNLLALSRGVVAGSIVERECYSAERLLRSSATIVLDDGQRLEIIDGGLWNLLTSIFRKCRWVEHRYAAYREP